MENPFKFGTIVEAEYFTDRVNEVAYISQFVNSAVGLARKEEKVRIAWRFGFLFVPLQQIIT